jgi:hypothetical protein
VFAGHRVVRSRRLPSHNGRSLPPRHCSPTRDVDVTRHQQEFPDSRPIPVLPLTCDHHGWDDGPWAFPWASHPTDQEPATHATVGTRSNTDPELRLRHPSILPHELTHNVRLRVATTLTAHIRASPKPDRCNHCTNRSPTSTNSSSYASTAAIASAASSTSTTRHLTSTDVILGRHRAPLAHRPCRPTTHLGHADRAAMRIGTGAEGEGRGATGRGISSP